MTPRRAPVDCGSLFGRLRHCALGLQIRLVGGIRPPSMCDRPFEDLPSSHRQVEGRRPGTLPVPAVEPKPSLAGERGLRAVVAGIEGNGETARRAT